MIYACPERPRLVGSGRASPPARQKGAPLFLLHRRIGHARVKADSTAKAEGAQPNPLQRKLWRHWTIAEGLRMSMSVSNTLPITKNLGQTPVSRLIEAQNPPTDSGEEAIIPMTSLLACLALPLFRFLRFSDTKTKTRLAKKA